MPARFVSGLLVLSSAGRFEQRTERNGACQKLFARELFSGQREWPRIGRTSVGLFQELSHRAHASAATRPCAACAPYLTDGARACANFFANSPIINALTVADEHGGGRGVGG